jgi:predicted small secreted protein
MTPFRRLILTALAAGIAGASLAACNTVEGVGKDLKSAGKKVEEIAKDDDKKK